MPDLTTAEDVVVSTTRPAPQREVRRQKQPQYVVIVENDDFHTFDYVIEALQKVCGHSVHEAERLAHEVHHSGQAAVWQGSKEVAELKRDQIRGYGPDAFARKPVNFPLGCYIEPLGA